MSDKEQVIDRLMGDSEKTLATARFRDAGAYRDAGQPGEPVGDFAGRPVFLESDFGVGVQIAPEGDQLRQEVCQPLVKKIGAHDEVRRRMASGRRVSPAVPSAWQCSIPGYDQPSR